jgi:hypothetical protein
VIDRGNDRSWPDDIVNRLNEFRQGTLVAQPPFAYHASATNPIWIGSRLVTADDDPVLIELDPADWPPYGVVTTQSCDVDEEGRSRKPWVQIAPVYELPTGDGNLGNIRNWRSMYLAPVTALGPTWIADLRIEFPLEKSWLVLSNHRPGFRTPEEFDQFEKFCGNQRSRPALDTGIYDRVSKPLRTWLLDLSQHAPDDYRSFVQALQHLYLYVQGDRLGPQAVQVVFVGERKLSMAVVERLDAWWESVYSQGDPPFTLLPNRYLTFDEVRFVELRNWLEQNLAALVPES